MSVGLWGVAPTQAQEPASEAVAGVPESQAGRWTAGSSMGFLGSTPDGTALAMNGQVDYGVTDRVSVGPLLQVGLTDDQTLVGLSPQVKYGIDMPGTHGRGKLVLQGGVGFAHSDFLGDDTSWLVPLGVGYDYTLQSGLSLTATSMVNFTDLHTGGGTGADVMPGFLVGLRF